MNNTAKYLGLFLTLTFGYSVIAQTAGSDIWLGHFKSKGATETIEDAEIKWAQITNKPDYHNQPYFHLKSNSLLYTAMVDQKQTDIFRYDLHTGLTNNLTRSDESEYSPTVMPNMTGLSGIIVDEKGKQWLWQWSLSGKSKGRLLAAEPIGYHVWLNDSEVLTFVLGKQQEPVHTLQRFTVNSSNTLGEVIDKHIGASLWPIPKSAGFSYSRTVDSEHQLMMYQPKSSNTTYLTNLPSSSAYYAWTPDGYAVTPESSGKDNAQSKLIAWSMEAQQWQPYLDLGEKCASGISRLAFSDDYKYIAVVCNRKQ